MWVFFCVLKHSQKTKYRFFYIFIGFPIDYEYRKCDIYLVDIKKPFRLRHQKGLVINTKAYEVIMNQTASHSQTPKFGHIPSTGILRQQPPSSVQIAKSNKRAKAKAWMQDTMAVLVVLGTIGSVPFMVRSCSDDVDRQHAQAIKHQLQFQASNGVNR